MILTGNVHKFSAVHFTLCISSTAVLLADNSNVILEYLYQIHVSVLLV